MICRMCDLWEVGIWEVSVIHWRCMGGKCDLWEVGVWEVYGMSKCDLCEVDL